MTLDDGREVVVNWTGHKARAGATDGRYGPTIEPDEPAYIEVDSVIGPDGKEIDDPVVIEAAVDDMLMESSGYYDDNPPERERDE
jgi:hypothetical protein